MERPKRDDVIFVKSDRPLVERLKLAALLTDSTMSHITREAIREKLEQLSEKHPELKPAPVTIEAAA